MTKMEKRRRTLLLTVFFALLALVGRLGFYIATPPWLDTFRDLSPINLTNITDGNDTDSVDILPSHPVGRQGNIFFLLLGQYLSTTIIFGLSLLMLAVIKPNCIQDAYKNFAHRSIIISGSSQGISAILMNLAMSGTRTPPYLQALLANFTVPIQFIVRFIVLRKRSTRLQLVCAGVVVLAEFVCLIPSIFPGLESDSQKKEEGGSTGAGRILWPLCMVLSQVPFALANTLMEKSVQKQENEKIAPSTRYDTMDQTSEEDNENLLPLSKDSQTQGTKPGMNIFYYGFIWSLTSSLTICAFFWVDLLPHVGTSENINTFKQTFTYDAGCIVGQHDCGPDVYLIGWVAFLSCFVACLGFTGLMKYSEGANFVIIFLSLRTPIVLLVWTLFDEHPLTWHPHVSLATWLSIASVFVMFPAVLIYQLGLPKCHMLRQRLSRNNSGIMIINEEDDIQNLNSDDEDHIASRDHR